MIFRAANETPPPSSYPSPSSLPSRRARNHAKPVLLWFLMTTKKKAPDAREHAYTRCRTSSRVQHIRIYHRCTTLAIPGIGLSRKDPVQFGPKAHDAQR